MFASRVLARAAPRISVRSLSTATRRVLTSTPKQSITSQLRPSTLRCFSISCQRSDASATELAAKLQSELQLEQDESEGNPSQSDNNVKEFLDSHDWTLIDNEGEQAVKLRRKYDDETIEVTFTVADFPPPYGEEDEMDDALLDEDDMETQSGGANTKGAVSQGRTSGGNVKVGQTGDVSPGTRDELADVEDETSGSQQPFPASVTVTISRDGKPGVLRFELVAEDGEFSVQSVTPLPSVEDATGPGFALAAEKHWAGPPFAQLDEELQSFFENYLTERGINEGLANVVPDYIDVKEQKEYLAWLKKVKEYVD